MGFQEWARLGGEEFQPQENSDCAQSSHGIEFGLWAYTGSVEPRLTAATELRPEVGGMIPADGHLSARAWCCCTPRYGPSYF